MHGLPKTRNDEKQGFVMTQIFPNRIVDEFLIFSMSFLAGRLKHESPQPEAYPNDGADVYACAGADWHAVPDSVLRVIAFRNIAATGTHKMMVEILRRRRAAERVAVTRDDVEPEHELADLSSGSDELGFSESIPGDTSESIPVTLPRESTLTRVSFQLR